MQRIKTKREKEERHKAIILVPSINRKQSSPPCTSKEISLKCNVKLQLLIATTSKRLQIAQAHTQETSYAPEHNQETSNAQAQLQETSNQTKLQLKMFEIEHLIYNQWCSQYKSDTDS